VNGDSTTYPRKEDVSPNDASGVEYSAIESDSTGGGEGGRPLSGAQEGDGRGESGIDLAQVRHSVRDGFDSRIPGRLTPDPSETLIQAFLDGDVELAYKSATTLAGAYHEALAEGARLRFKLNFGTSTCENCEGLHAGPGVQATCFQVQRCNYTNIRDGHESERQQRLISRLLRK
jgi:hypothetical protein